MRRALTEAVRAGWGGLRLGPAGRLQGQLHERGREEALKDREVLDPWRQGLGGWRSIHYKGSCSRKYLERRQPEISSDAAEESAICTCKYVLWEKGSQHPPLSLGGC